MSGSLIGGGLFIACRSFSLSQASKVLWLMMLPMLAPSVRHNICWANFHNIGHPPFSYANDRALTRTMRLLKESEAP